MDFRFHQRGGNAVRFVTAICTNERMTWLDHKTLPNMLNLLIIPPPELSTSFPTGTNIQSPITLRNPKKDYYNESV